MNNRNYIIGENIYFYCQQKNISKNEFCSVLNYSEVEYDKLIEGRLAIFHSDINDIANFLQIPIEELISYSTEHDRLHCHNEQKFSSQENKEKILDYFTMYINLQEYLLTNKKGCLS